MAKGHLKLEIPCSCCYNTKDFSKMYDRRILQVLSQHEKILLIKKAMILLYSKYKFLSVIST